ncbi:MAG TPA: amidohydrolase family protein, partial [Caulobacteraceae bacterium]
GTPFVIHVGGAPLQAGGPWMNTGRPAARDWMGGGENLRTKDIAIAHQSPEAFVSMMVIDGLLERHPALRGAVVELGAGWVPELVRRLDWVVDHWKRVDEGLRSFTRKPSEQICEQLAFTPFVFEPVGELIDQSSAELYLFSTDYPHVEGGRNPIGRFEAALGDRSEAVRDLFYAENFLRIFPDARVAAKAQAAVSA